MVESSTSATKAWRSLKVMEGSPTSGLTWVRREPGRMKGSHTSDLHVVRELGVGKV